jgi:hypothetical protein
MAEALFRNVYRSRAECREAAARLARYVESARMALAKCDVAQGAAEFGPLDLGRS